MFELDEGRNIIKHNQWTTLFMSVCNINHSNYSCLYVILTTVIIHVILTTVIIHVCM